MPLRFLVPCSDDPESAVCIDDAVVEFVLCADEDEVD